MLYNILLIVQIIVSVAMIVLILMQHGKGADAGAAFGSGASGTVFGSQGSGNFLSRTTAILATAFFVNSLVLAMLISNQTKSSSMTGSIMQSQTITAPSNKPAPNANGVPTAPTVSNSEVPAAPAVSAPSEVPAAPAVTAPAGSTSTVPAAATPAQPATTTPAQ